MLSKQEAFRRKKRRQRRWASKNRERKLETTRRWRAEHREHCIAYSRRYRQDRGIGLPKPCVVCGRQIEGQSNTCSMDCRLIRHNALETLAHKRSWATRLQREKADPTLREQRQLSQRQYHKTRMESDPQFRQKRRTRAVRRWERIKSDPQLLEEERKKARNRRRKIAANPEWRVKQNARRREVERNLRLTNPHLWKKRREAAARLRKRNALAYEILKTMGVRINPKNLEVNHVPESTT